MGVDFERLVLGPAVRVFGHCVTVTPRVSNPFAAPYQARGIWTITQVDVVTEDGGALSSRTLKFGIRLCDFAVKPKQGDWITSPVCDLPLGYWQGDLDPGADIDLEVADFQPDGQGGATLVLKRKTKI